MVFRISKDREGETVCPGCRRLLKIPTKGDRTPVLVKQAGPGAARGNVTDPGWEEDEGAAAGEPVSTGWKWAVIGVIAFMGVLALAFYAIGSRRGSAPGTGEFDMAALTTGELEAPSAGGDPRQVELPPLMERNETELLREMEPLTKRFLEARTVEEMLPLVHKPEVVEPRLRAIYPDGSLPAPGMSVFNSSGSVSFRGSFASVSVLTRNHDRRFLAYRSTPQGLRIDWESWEGWSEMSWERFMEEKPTEPKLFRVLANRVDYYNFSFQDDRRWQAYRLASPDGDHVLYGYVPRGTSLDDQLAPNGTATDVPYTLMLKFPEGDHQGRNQVLIESCLTEGWVLSDEEEQ